MPSDRRMFLSAGLGVTAALASGLDGRRRKRSIVRRFPAMSALTRRFAPQRPMISAVSFTGNRAAYSNPHRAPILRA